MCVTITLDENSILIVLDAIRAKKNELYDSMVFSEEKDVLKVEEIFSKALEAIKVQKVMSMEMKI